MDNAGRRRSFAVLPSCDSGGAVHSCETVGGNFSDEANVVGRNEEVEILRTADLGVGENAIPQEEPAGSPAFAVVGPFVENAGDGGLRSLSSIAMRSRRREATGSEKRRRLPLRRMFADSWTLEGDTAQRVHLFHSHFSLPYKIFLPNFRSFLFILM